MAKTKQKINKRQRSGIRVSRGLYLFSALFLSGALAVAAYGLPSLVPVTYDAQSLVLPVQQSRDMPLAEEEEIYTATHIPTPDAVKAIYMTSCVAGTPSFRSDLVTLIEETEINSVVIDIKDYTGGISFITDEPMLKDAVFVGCTALDMPEFIAALHGKNIYVIGRITVFQDPYYIQKHPDVGIKRSSDTSVVWTDYKGISFIDPGAKEFWDYIITLSKESYAIGFDELNFDYVRFPSDGNMQNIFYPFSEERIVRDPDYGKARVVREFFRYLHTGLQDTDVIASADLFGMVTTNSDDLNVGQVLEFALPYFDYIAPMVYPSHYPKYFNGYANPNHYPYEIVRYSMDSAVERTRASTTRVRELGETPIASTTPQLYTKEAFDPLKLRPWLQDFDYGGDYDIKEVRAQIQAVYDAGLTSWMLWAPSNRYTVGALDPVVEFDTVLP